MGPKKQAAKQGEEEDNSTRDFFNYYKKYCKELEVPVFKPLENKITELMEEGLHLNEILINDKIGEFGARALFNALKNVKYKIFFYLFSFYEMKKTHYSKN